MTEPHDGAAPVMGETAAPAPKAANRRLPMLGIAAGATALALGGWWMLTTTPEPDAPEPPTPAPAATSAGTPAAGSAAAGTPAAGTPATGAAAPAGSAPVAGAPASVTPAAGALPVTRSSVETTTAPPLQIKAVTPAPVNAAPKGINEEVVYKARPTNPFQPLVVKDDGTQKTTVPAPTIAAPRPAQAMPAPARVTPVSPLSGGALPVPRLEIGSSVSPMTPGVLSISPIPGARPGVTVTPIPGGVQPGRPVAVPTPGVPATAVPVPSAAPVKPPRPATQHETLALDLSRSGVVLEAVIFGDPDGALLRQGEEYLSLSVGELIPGTDILLDRVEAESVVFARGQAHRRLPMASQGPLVPEVPLEPQDDPTPAPESALPTAVPALPLGAALRSAEVERLQLSVVGWERLTRLSLSPELAAALAAMGPASIPAQPFPALVAASLPRSSEVSQ